MNIKIVTELGYRFVDGEVIQILDSKLKYVLFQDWVMRDAGTLYGYSLTEYTSGACFAFGETRRRAIANAKKTYLERGDDQIIKAGRQLLKKCKQKYPLNRPFK